MASYSTGRPCPNCNKPSGMPVRCLNCGTVGCGFCVGNGPGGFNQKWKSNCKVCLNTQQELMTLA